MSAVTKRQNWTDAYDAQMSLWRWYRTDPGRHYMIEHAHANIGAVHEENTRQMLERMYAAEEWRLLSCDPIYVSEEMCEVIEHAAESFKIEPLLETDLITPRGFAYFAKPFTLQNLHSEPTRLAAVSWTRLFYAEDEEVNEKVRRLMDIDETVTAATVDDEVASLPGVSAGGVMVTLYTDRPLVEPWASAGAQPIVSPLHLTPWFYNMSTDSIHWDEIGFPTAAEEWWRFCQTAFRLMQQRIAVKRIERPDRARRREAKRFNLDEELDVLVVRLRREQSEAKEPSGEEANYSHRFIVGGHWRNQWYGSEQIHRQIWISPYVKGPEDKPLIVKPRRVYTWDR